MQQRKILLQQNQFSWVIERICCQLVERFNDFENTCLIGVQPRGVMLAERFLIENKNVILVDDVLYTGRTIHAAISALQHFGRPNCVELVVLVDRRFNRDLPIQCTYRGISVDTLGNAHVRVMWASDSEIDKVELIEK